MTREVNKVSETLFGDGTRFTHDWDFFILKKDELQVTIVDTLTATRTILDPTDFTATGFGDKNGGTVTYPLTGSAIPSTTKITLERQAPFSQTTKLSGVRTYNPEAVELALDRLEDQIQQVNSKFDRAFKIPVSDDSTDTEVAIVESRKGKWAYFNATTGNLEGNAQAAVTLAGSSTDVLAIFETKSVVALTNVGSLNSLLVLGHSSVNDGGRAFYKRVGSEPAHEGKVQSADSVWFELCAFEGFVWQEQFGTTNSATSLLNMMGYLDRSATAREVGIITQDSTVTSWAGYEINNRLHLKSAGATLTFATPVATEFVEVDAAGGEIVFEGINFVGVNTFDFFSIANATGTWERFALLTCNLETFKCGLNADNQSVWEDIEIRNCEFKDFQSGWNWDTLISRAVVENNTILDWVHSVDVHMYGFRMGKDAAFGYSNQGSSHYIWMCRNKVDNINNSAGTTVNNQIQVFMATGQDVIMDANIVEGVTSTRSSDVEVFYSKARRVSVQHNHIKDGGKQQGAITIKGENPLAGSALNPVGEFAVVANNICWGGERFLYSSSHDVSMAENRIFGCTGVSAFFQNNSENMGHLKVNDNLFQGCAQGLIVEGMYDTLLIQDNAFRELDNGASNTTGISLDTASNAYTTSSPGMTEIRGNVFSDFGGTSTRQGLLFDFHATASRNPPHLQIVGNRFDNIATRNIRFGGTGEVPDFVEIRDNVAAGSVVGWNSLNTQNAPFKTLVFDNNRVFFRETSASARVVLELYHEAGTEFPILSNIYAKDQTTGTDWKRVVTKAIRTMDSSANIQTFGTDLTNTTNSGAAGVSVTLGSTAQVSPLPDSFRITVQGDGVADLLWNMNLSVGGQTDRVAYPPGIESASDQTVFTADGSGGGTWEGRGHAEIYTEDSDAISLGGIGTTPITLPFEKNGEAIISTADAANNRLSTGTAGVFAVHFSISFATTSVTDAGEYEFKIAVNGTATELEAFKEMSGTADTGQLSVVGLLTLAANDLVTVQVSSDEAGGTDDINIRNAILYMFRRA